MRDFFRTRDEEIEEELWRHFNAFVSYCMMLPFGVKGMTYSEFCDDVREGIRTGDATRSQE